MRTVFIAALCLTTCAACASLPSLPDEQVLPVEAVVKAVQCEMQRAVERATSNGRHKWLLGWEAAYVFTINITETGYVKAASNTFPIPISPGLLTLGVGGGLTRTSKRIAKLSFTPKVSEIKSYDCRDVQPIMGHPFISSRIGFSEWLNRALDGADPSQPESRFVPKAAQPINVGHTFDFTIDLNASVSPTFLVAPGGATLTPAGSYDRADDDILDVTFAAPKADTTKTSGTTMTPITVVVQLTEKQIHELATQDQNAEEASQKIENANLEKIKIMKKNGIKFQALPNKPDVFFDKQSVEKLDTTAKHKFDDLTAEIKEARINQIRAVERAKYLRSLSGPRTALRRASIQTTTVSSASNNISAQEALQQLQLERLLSGPRSP